MPNLANGLFRKDVVGGNQCDQKCGIILKCLLGFIFLVSFFLKDPLNSKR